MSERPTDRPAWRAAEPDGQQNDEPRRVAPARYETGMVPSGESLAVRAERFRNGAPFLVERATLYDPFPLEPLHTASENRLPRPRPLLSAALTLLGVVIVVGLSAAILFVRNPDGPRIDPAERMARTPPTMTPHMGPGASASRDGVAYDLTKRADDVITGAWRPHKNTAAQPGNGDREQAGPAAAPAPAPPAVAIKPPLPDAPRRALPRRLTVTPFALPRRQMAEPLPPPRPPLDDPYVPNVAVGNQPHLPRSAVPDGTPAHETVTPGMTDRTGPNVVARVRRAGDPAEGQARREGRKVALPTPPSEAQIEAAAKGGAMSRRARREHLRRMREARRDAQDVDRFQLRDRGDIPKGFVYSGPQGQRP